MQSDNNILYGNWTFLEATDYHYKMLKDAELELYCMYYLKQSVTGYVQKNRGGCLYVAKLYERQQDLNKIS
jgi:hypothetical protein